MPDVIREFFERMRGPQPVPFADLPARVRGTVRVDIHSNGTTERWFVTMGRGGAVASRAERKPNAVLSGSRSLFDRLLRGEEQLYASILRNELQLEGDGSLASYLVRLLPGPPRAHDPRAASRQGRSSG